MHSLPIDEAKRRLPMPLLMRRLGVPENSIPQRDGQCVRCPWPQLHKHGDRSPSFNTHAGGTAFKCFACGESGDGPRFTSLWMGLNHRDGFRKFLDLAGGLAENPSAASAEKAASTLGVPLPPLDLGRKADLELIAAHRKLNPAALHLARAHGCLRFGQVCGHRCWILLDDAQRVAEARRVDGKPFPALGDLPERKAHTLRGSRKNWPLGVAKLRCRARFAAVLLVEGGPDFLAALHFALALERYDVWPIAMLGRQAGSSGLHSDALTLLRGHRIRLYPHLDPDGAGLTCATNWAKQLHNHGCQVDFFTFDGLGVGVGDLNDCTALAEVPESLLPEEGMTNVEWRMAGETQRPPLPLAA